MLVSHCALVNFRFRTCGFTRYSSGTWSLAAGINGMVSTQLGGSAAVTNANGQVELSVFATAPNNPMTLRAVWIDAQQQTHSGFVVLTVVADRSVSIDLG